MFGILQGLYALAYCLPDSTHARLFPEDTNPTAERERARLDEAAMANARRIEALNVPEPFFIDRATGRYYENPERVAYDAARR